MANYTGIKKIKIGDNTFELAVDWSVVTNKPTIPTNTDENLKTVALTSGTTYYPILATGANAAANRQVDSTLKGFRYSSSAGTTSTVGIAALYLGNSTASGTANNEQGKIVLYGEKSYSTELYSAATTGNRTVKFPDKGGTVALTTDIPTVSYPVTSVNSKTGAVSLTASDVGALASSTTYVSTITTSAGSHTTISSKSGAVSFNIPTKTSHLTNDSGFITSHKSWALNTALSGTSPNSILTITLSDGGSSSSSKTFTLIAGSGLSLTNDTTNTKVTVAHSNSVTAGTAGTSSATSGSTLAVPYVTYDAQGHITGSGTHTHTISGFATSDTKNTAGSTNSTSKLFLVGATSQAASPQTYSRSSAYVGTDGYLYSGSSKVLTVSDAIDYITSQGVSGDWHYRKYASGREEAVFYGTFTGSTPTQTSTYYYRSSSNSFSIPSGIFSGTPICVGTNIDNSSTVMFGLTITMTSATAGTWQVYRTNANAVSFTGMAFFVYFPS